MTSDSEWMQYSESEPIPRKMKMRKLFYTHNVKAISNTLMFFMRNMYTDYILQMAFWPRAMLKALLFLFCCSWRGKISKKCSKCMEQKNFANKIYSKLNKICYKGNKIVCDWESCLKRQNYSFIFFFSHFSTMCVSFYD